MENIIESTPRRVNRVPNTVTPEEEKNQPDVVGSKAYYCRYVTTSNDENIPLRLPPPCSIFPPAQVASHSAFIQNTMFL